VLVATLLFSAAVAAWAFAGKTLSSKARGGDLVVSKIGPTASTVAPGASFGLVVQLRNGDRRALAKPRVRALLSLDKRLGGEDVVVARSSLGRIEAKTSRRLRLSAVVPSGTAASSYWLLVCASAKSKQSDCGRAVRLSVQGARVPVQTPLPPPSPTVPAPAQEGDGEGSSLITAKVGSCRPVIAVSALAGQPSVVEGGEIEYSAAIRNEPAGACLNVGTAQTVGGEIELETSIADLAMWIELADGAGRSVLPLSSGLTTSGSGLPGACPGATPPGCKAEIQEVVGNVFYPQGKARDVGAGEEVTIPFRFFPTLFGEDLDRIATAPAGGVRLVVAAETPGGEVLISTRPLDFSTAPWIEELDLEVQLPDGTEQALGVGSLAPGDQADLEPAAFYATSANDPDTVVASFRAQAASPEPVSSSRVDVSTVITNDPATRPVFPTASPSAATVGTTPTILVGVSLPGNVESEPTVFLDGPETELGTLNDEGEAGDAVAADGIWSGEVQVPMTETRTLRVDAVLDELERSGRVEVEALPIGAPTEPAATPVSITIETAAGGVVLADRIVVQMAEGSTYPEVVAAAERVEGTVAGRISPGTWQVEIPVVADEEELYAVLAEISSAAGVIGAEPEPVYEGTGVTPNDPLFNQQSHLNQIGADRAWIVARGGSPRIAVAVLDTGVDRDHQDLASRLLPAPDFGEGDGNPEDTCGHGTHVAGTVGAATNNGRQVAGVDWNAALMPVKVFPDVAGPAHCHDVGAVGLPAAIRWAVDHGARVINMSLGGPQRSEADAQALQYAWEAGRVVVAAAGNDGSSSRAYPAGFERTEEFSSWFGLSKRTYRTDVLAVGNVTSTDVRAGSSNFGSWVDVAAPGTNILSTHLGGSTTGMTGTSMAAPVVSGVASLMISNGVRGPERVRSLLVSSGKPLNQSVGPRVDAFEAVFNGSFEGGLETWSRSGTVQTISRLGPIVPQAGSRMLALSTGPDSAQVLAKVSKAMQLRADALRDGVVRLSLRYDYVTEEYPEFVGSQYNDSLIVVARLPNGETRVLADESVNTTNWTPVSGIDFPGGDFTAGQSGWKTVGTTIPASALGGAGEITIEVFDMGDAIYDSVALVDAVRLE
jgi:subtilisin family serine protease